MTFLAGRRIDFATGLAWLSDGRKSRASAGGAIDFGACFFWSKSSLHNSFL
jgi:hypothetical protein